MRCWRVAQARARRLAASAAGARDDIEAGPAVVTERSHALLGDQPIRLNVSGQPMLTSLRSLTKHPGSVLAAVASAFHAQQQELRTTASAGDHNGARGELFLDRDPEPFGHLLSWLRTGCVPPRLDRASAARLETEARFFCLPALAEACATASPGSAALSHAELLACINAGQPGAVQLSGADLRGLRIPGAKLAKAHMPGCELGGADLRGADLRGACLNDVLLRGTQLDDAQLQDAELARVDLSKASLRGVRLDGATLTQAVLPEDLQAAFGTEALDLSRCKLAGVDLRERDLRAWRLWGADLRGCLLDGSALPSDLHGVALAPGASLLALGLSGVAGVSFAGGVLAGCDLRDCDCRGWDFTGCDCTGADFRRADLSGAKLAGAKLTNARLHEAEGADLSGATLTGSDLRLMGLHGAAISLMRAALEECDASGCDARGWKLRGATCSRGNFSRADLTGVDLNGTTLVGGSARMLCLPCLPALSRLSDPFPSDAAAQTRSSTRRAGSTSARRSSPAATCARWA
jgi:uncharacterized protein YjbI with pentapeptide repeats